MTWTEVPLFEYARDVVEVTARIGAVDDQHLQWQFEAHDPVTGELVGLQSTPHIDPTSSPAWFESFLAEFEHFVRLHIADRTG